MSSYHEVILNLFFNLVSFLADITVILIGLHEFFGWTPFRGKMIKEDVVPQVADGWNKTANLADRAFGLLDKVVPQFIGGGSGGPVAGQGPATTQNTSNNGSGGINQKSGAPVPSSNGGQGAGGFRGTY